MKTMRERLVSGAAGLAVGSLLLSLASAPAYGQYRWGHIHSGAFGLLSPGVLKAVGLTAEQQEQIQRIIDAHKENVMEIWTMRRTVRGKMADLLFGPSEVKEADLSSQVREMVALQEKFMQERIKVALEVRAVLTPDQLSKAARIRSRMRELRAEMRRLYGEN